MERRDLFSARSRVVRTAVVVLLAMIATSCLREPASDAGLQFGYAVKSALLASNDRYADIVAADATIVTAENDMKWVRIHPGPDVYDFTRADQIVASAQANGQSVRGHTLVWHNGLPGWVENGEWTRETLLAVMEEHITTVVGHFRDEFPGVVTQWDVVNEAFMPDGSRRPSLFQEVIGDDYIAQAFEFAHAADPTVELYYNDYYADLNLVAETALYGAPAGPGLSATLDDCDDIPKCASTRDLAADLTAADVPIDGIGFQAHWLTTDVGDYSAFASWIEPLGLRWALTEIDLGLVASTPETLNAQALGMRSMVEDCLQAPNCDTTVFWGVTDDNSWLPGFSGGIFGHPLLYDENGAPKPAVAQLLDLLNEWSADAS